MEPVSLLDPGRAARLLAYAREAIDRYGLVVSETTRQIAYFGYWWMCCRS